MTTIANNPDTTPQVLQTYTLLQIAAEAMFGQAHDRAAAVPGSGALKTFKFDAKGSVLIQGNDHTSKMTAAQAAQFAADWEVVSHQPNTATGFSATLFKLKADRADPDKGTYEGQHVVCIRSTELVDDNVRDGKVADEMEISQGGWACGQIADMQLWWGSVKPLLNGTKVDVTGYSIGGHLATAFYERNKLSVVNRYMFNEVVTRVNDPFDERVNGDRALAYPRTEIALFSSMNDAEYHHAA